MFHSKIESKAALAWRFHRFSLSCLLLYSVAILGDAHSFTTNPTIDILADLHNVPKQVEQLVRDIDYSSLIRFQREEQVKLSMRYDISHGTSSLRSLNIQTTTPLLGCLQQLAENKNNKDTYEDFLLSKGAISLLLLCRHLQSDAAHEVLLGVETTNIDDAEYAATHPGKTSWAVDHPLTAYDDMVHSVLHRMCEGDLVGEGGYTGWENAAFWAAGGPKMNYYSSASSSDENHRPPNKSDQHPVRSALAMAALQYAPDCVNAGIVSLKQPGQQHVIIAGGGRNRTVSVPTGWWDPFCYIDLLRAHSTTKHTSALQSELDWLQELELRLLLRFELLQSMVSHSAHSLLTFQKPESE